MGWLYNGQQFDPTDEFLDQYVGFVYLITDTETGMKYIGKKLLWKIKRRPPLKGKKRRRSEKVQSDWRTYFSSSPTIQQLHEQHGDSRFKREILMLCTSKGECSYMEAKLQFDHDVLRRPDFHNGIINCRINRSHLRND